MLQARTISPKEAGELLRTNTKNRKINQKIVRLYSSQIANDEWFLNGETVKISTGGKLLDGQHRLAAIVDANKAIKTYVVTDIDAKAFETIDVGRRRSPADALVVAAGVTDANNIAAALRVVHNFETDKKNAYKIWKDKEQTMTHAQLIKFYKKHKSIERHNTDSWRFKMANKLCTRSTIASMSYLFHQIDPELNAEFWHKLDLGNDLSPYDPIGALRNSLIKFIANNGGKKPHRRLQLAMIVTAWNACRSKTPMEKLIVDDKAELPIE